MSAKAKLKKHRSTGLTLTYFVVNILMFFVSKCLNIVCFKYDFGSDKRVI